MAGFRRRGADRLDALGGALQAAPPWTLFSSGMGNAQHPEIGGYPAYGAERATTVADHGHRPGAATSTRRTGYRPLLTVADLQGGTDVFAGSLDQESYALNASNGSALPGWPFFTADSVFSTAALEICTARGKQELVVGGASSAGSALGLSYTQGGHLRVLNAQGGQTLRLRHQPGGRLFAGDRRLPGRRGPRIAVGTGSYYGGASDTDTIKAFTTRLGLVWSETLDGLTNSSPALADVEGGSQLDVVEGTDTATSGLGMGAGRGNGHPGLAPACRRPRDRLGGGG